MSGQWINLNAVGPQGPQGDPGPAGPAGPPGSDASVATGVIVEWPAAAAPAGWHLCDGSAHGSPALTALLGSAFTPDLRGFFIPTAGVGSYALKETGGADMLTLTAAQSGLVGHSHAASSGSQSVDHAHLADPPATNSGGQSVNHGHSGATASMNRNQSHGHLVYEGLTTGDSDNWVDTADDDGTGRARTNIVRAANTDHEHGFSTGVESATHVHATNIPAFWTGGVSASHSHVVTVTAAAAASAAQAFDNRPRYYALNRIIKL